MSHSVSPTCRASAAFYQRLGFEQAFRFDDSGTTAVDFLKINDHQFIELYPRTADSQPLGMMHICFEADDLAALRAEYLKRNLAADRRQPGARRQSALLHSTTRKDRCSNTCNTCRARCISRIAAVIWASAASRSTWCARWRMSGRGRGAGILHGQAGLRGSRRSAVRLRFPEIPGRKWNSRRAPPRPARASCSRCRTWRAPRKNCAAAAWRRWRRRARSR
jgi:catechol 2,3-dioxygenase-like lactoylglutathione lyase family enzyme